VATDWRVYKNDTLARKLDRSELPGFFVKKVTAGLNEAAIVVRDGVPQEVLTESQSQAADVLDQLKSRFGLGADISVYFVALAPFDITLFLGAQDTAAVSTQVAVTSQTAAVSTQVAVTSQREAQAASLKAAQAGQPAERRSTWLRETVERAARHVGWLQEEEFQGQVSASVASQLDVSQVCVIALSADGEVISAVCRLRLRVDGDNLRKLVGLLKGKNALATWDVAALIRDELLGKVLLPEIARHPSSSLRGDRGLLGQVEAETRNALAGTLSAFGLLLDDFSVTWGLTEQERREIALRRARREEQALEFAKNRRIAHMMRQQEIDRTRIANLQELKTADAAGMEEIKKLHLAASLERDLLVKNHKVDAARVDAQIREITLQVAKNEAQARLEQRRAAEELRLDLEDRQFKQRHAARLAAIEAGDKEMWSMVKMQIEMATQKHERELARRHQELDAELRKLQSDIDDRYQQRKLKLDESTARMAMIEHLVSQGLSTGQADASVLNTMLQQATEQEYATTSDQKVQARAEAEAAGKNLEAFRTAQRDERAHQRDMISQAAAMMEAAKQSPPGVIVPGALPNPPQAAPGPQPPSPGPLPAGTGKALCPKCQNEIHPGMKFCPFCGNPHAAATR
jgi:hypothetical protein